MSQSAKDRIFTAIRDALPAGGQRTPYPEYDPQSTISAARLPDGADPWETFAANLKAVNGKLVDSPEQLAGLLVALGHRRGVCDPDLLPKLTPALEAAGLAVESALDRTRFEDYEFGITRGSAVIAESGTVVLDDNRTFDRLAALAPWTHVAVVAPDDLIPSVAQAVENLGSSPNVIWCTGPSKTADVEGILIEGVHGPGEQVVLKMG